MTRSLDVLLIESEANAGLHAADALDAGGHRVHRCFPHAGVQADEQSPGSPMCVAVIEGACPIDDGSIDVAVVAGPSAKDRPTLTAAGVTCALRRHIPLVADDNCPSSFGSRLAGRANGDVVGACVRAAADSFADLRTDILTRITPTVVAEHLDPQAIGCRFETDGPRLNVTITGPEAGTMIRQALGVRVLDAVRASGRVYGQVNVAYETTS
jgi:hypothetical protein